MVDLLKSLKVAISVLCLAVVCSSAAINCKTVENLYCSDFCKYSVLQLFLYIDNECVHTYIAKSSTNGFRYNANFKNKY